MLVGTFAWAAYTVCLRWRPSTLPPLAFLTVIAGMGVVAITPLYAIEIMQGAWLKLNTATVLGIAYIGVGATVIAYIFWNRGVAQLGSGRTGPFMYLMPVFTALLAVIFLDERLQSYHVVGIGLIAFGIYLTTKPTS